MTILIPAYKPDYRLIELIKNIKSVCDYEIVIVDDGSGEEYRKIFTEALMLGCEVVTHEKNMGKGRALKSGFLCIKENFEHEGVVCADCDGQHLPQDILRVASLIKNNPKSVIMGTRCFVGDVPLRSRFGNTLTRGIFSLVSGTKVSDTQTGLRGFSPEMLEWLCSIKGERYEYEMNMLLEVGSAGYSFYEVPIETVYLEDNKSSHFNPIKDSLLIYLPILKFCFSSLTSGILDFALLSVFQYLSHNLFLSVLGARICSATFNYTVNRLYVFNQNKKVTVKDSLSRYALLATTLMFLNYLVIYAYTHLGLSLLVAKILTEITIYVFSYIIQKQYVFKALKNKAA